MKKKYSAAILFIIILSLLGGFLSAQESPPPTPDSSSVHRGDLSVHRGDYLTLKIAIFGPGDPLYVWWGHIGLIVEDSLSGKANFYDYGLFSFENENFYLNFAFGRLLYSCGVSPARLNLKRYSEQNRDIHLLTLNLSPEKKEKVWRYVENNVRPENRDYYYHHFDDNCATRIRDVIDFAVDGQFHKASDRPARFTLREHTRRHTWSNSFFDWFLMFVMGQNIDNPITVWDEMFLPSEIELQIENFRYIDETGEAVNLVENKEIYNKAEDRKPVLEIPRKQWPTELAAALLLAGFIFLLKRSDKKAAGILMGLIHSFLGLFYGIAGSIVCFMSFFTNHDYSWNNLNVLFINPLFFVAIPLGIMVASGKMKERRINPDIILNWFWTIMATGALLAIVLNIFPRFYHSNQVTLALFLPPAVILSHYPRWTANFIRRIIKNTDK